MRFSQRGALPRFSVHRAGPVDAATAPSTEAFLAKLWTSMLERPAAGTLQSTSLAAPDPDSASLPDCGIL